MRKIAAALFAAVTLCATAGAMPAFAQPGQGAGNPSPVHGLAMHGAPKYGPDFKNFDYVNPNAPKGGDLRQAAIGNFDSLNPFIVKGQPAAGLGETYDTLMAGSADEAFSEYGLVAETVEVPQDRSWVIFNLRPQAKFNDGSPITADDVLFSFDILKTKGAPSYRLYYAGVAKAEKLGDRKVKFTFQPGDNRELPLILGQLPVLPKKYWDGKTFDQTTLEPPLGSGPYKVESFEPGRFITYKRVETYWGKDVPVRKGINNFDRIRIDYYRDSTVALEAFKAGEYDFRLENEAKKWATGYDFPALSQGFAKKQQFENERPTGMQGFVYNIRRPLFQDPKVRQALAYAFDFEWTNKNLFYGQYTRTTSYYSNSELASRGLPSPDELKILEPYKGRIPDEVFTKEYQPPASDGSGNIRDNMRIAMGLLKEAGWEVKNGKMVNGKTGQPFTFEILNAQPAWERITLPFIENLRRIGIEPTLRTVDTAQYKNRTDNFDYDMIVDVFGESLSPGNEQRSFWGSDAADAPGSRNSIGIKDKVIDELVEKLIAAPDRESLVARTRALDRVLLWHHYVIPHWHLGYDRVAYWDKFGMPDKIPTQGVQIDAWWFDPAKAAKLPTRRTEARPPAGTPG